MRDPFDQLFGNLRRGPWHNDPNSVIQEAGARNGNIESQGWLSNGSVTADVIQAGAITAGKIEAGSITSNEIAALTITAGNISGEAITTAKLAAEAVNANKILAGAITTDKLAANAVTAAKIEALTITAGEISGGAITTAKIAAEAINSAKIKADAIETNHITAGNVTSSKIELVVTGKRFGANNGGAGTPGIFFDTSSNTGLFLSGGDIWVAHGGATTMTLDGRFMVGPVEPALDNTIGLGDSGKRWTEVWAVDGSINTSDAREKRDIADSELGLAFVRALRPRKFRWADTVDTQAVDAARAAYDEASLGRELAPHERRIADLRQRQLRGDTTATEELVEGRASRHFRDHRSAQDTS